jgi:hypothetical protein
VTNFLLTGRVLRILCCQNTDCTLWPWPFTLFLKKSPNYYLWLVLTEYSNFCISTLTQRVSSYFQNQAHTVTYLHTVFIFTYLITMQRTWTKDISNMIGYMIADRSYWEVCSSFALIIAHGLCSSGRFCLSNVGFTIIIIILWAIRTHTCAGPYFQCHVAHYDKNSTILLRYFRIFFSLHRKILTSLITFHSIAYSCISLNFL